MSSSPTAKSGFMITQRDAESNSKIRFYAKMTEAHSDAGNTLKSGYPIFHNAEVLWLPCCMARLGQSHQVWGGSFGGECMACNL
jgi:hypothetical protein